MTLVTHLNAGANPATRVGRGPLRTLKVLVDCDRRDVRGCQPRRRHCASVRYPLTLKCLNSNVCHLHTTTGCTPSSSVMAIGTYYPPAKPEPAAKTRLKAQRSALSSQPCTSDSIDDLSGLCGLDFPARLDVCGTPSQLIVAQNARRDPYDQHTIQASHGR